jgi:hypothetical protein
MHHFSLYGKGILIGSLLLSVSFFAQAQKRLHRRFNTQQVLLSTQKQYPDYLSAITSMEKSISEYQVGDDDRILNVPVVFHILAAPGQGAPNENQVRKQLEILNANFGSYTGKPGKKPSNAIAEQYTHAGASLKISFYIPEKIDDIPGIHTVKTDVKQWSLDNQIQDPKRNGIAPVDPAHVINVWVGELGKSNAGYAHLPGAPAQVDGIVIDVDYFGVDNGTAKAPYTGAKTLVHLMGSYLGLYELWNDRNPCADDMVGDTPIHNAPTETVSSEKNARYITLCNGFVHAMYMNFMDNTDDELLTLFTPGQKTRMRAVLTTEGLRKGLVKN